MMKTLSGIGLILAFVSLSHAGFLGDVCESSSNPCEPASSVSCDEAENVCICRQRFHEKDGKCLSALGESCDTVSSECAAIPYAQCDDAGLCSCIRGYKPIKGDFETAAPDEKIHCAVARIGEHCLEPQQCRLANSKFEEAKCVCKSGFVPDSKNTGCIQSASLLGDECEIGAQCSAVDPNSICKGANDPKKCACKINYFVQDSRDEKCLPVARKFGESCESLAECTSRLGVDASCSRTEGVCVCNDGLVPSIDEAKCLPKTALHEFCVQPQQCDAAMPHSDCGADFKCVCLDDYDEIQAICHKKPQMIGDACVESFQCFTHVTPDNVECQNGQCQCTTGHTPNAQFNECKPGSYYLDSPCVTDAQCGEKVENAFCDLFTRRCVCHDGLVPSADLERCLPRTGGLYGACVEAGQCTAEIVGEVDCIDAICNCKPNCHYLDETCWNTKRLQDACSDSRECRLAQYSKRAECNLSGFCACRANFTTNLIENQCDSASHVVAKFVTPALLLVLLRHLA